MSVMLSEPKQDLSDIQGVLSYLADGPFASDKVTRLSGGNANFLFRLHLLEPYNGHSTLVLKHAKPYVATEVNFPLPLERQKYEVAALRSAKGWMPEDSVVRVPVVHRFDEVANVIVMDDCGEQAVTLKQLIQENPPSLSVAQEIGSALGEFLSRCHERGSGDKSNVEVFDANVDGKRISGFVTYGRLIPTLTGKGNLPALTDPPLDVPVNRLQDISKLSSEMILAINSSLATFTMGDFWPGNIMITLGLGGKLERIHVLDWELAKTGLPGLDIGQFCAEMYLLSRFIPPRKELAMETISNFLKSYGCSHGVKSPGTRIAKTHMGAHLVAWTPRVPWGSKAQTREVVMEGVDILTGGEVEWFD